MRKDDITQLVATQSFSVRRIESERVEGHEVEVLYQSRYEVALSQRPVQQAHPAINIGPWGRISKRLPMRERTQTGRKSPLIAYRVRLVFRASATQKF